jgi:hypothetical protein
MIHFFTRVSKTPKSNVLWKILAVVGAAAVSVGVALARRRIMSRLKRHVSVSRRGGSIEVQASIPSGRRSRRTGGRRSGARRVAAAA